jgi:homoserine kinase
MPWSPVGVASVYDCLQYADESKRVMEAVAAKIMALVEGGPDNVIAFFLGNKGVSAALRTLMKSVVWGS